MPRPDSPEFGAVHDLVEIAREMRGEQEYHHDHGHVARTLVRAHDLRVVLIAIQAGAHIAEHVAQATVAIQVVSGRVRIRLPRLARRWQPYAGFLYFHLLLQSLDEAGRLTPRAPATQA